MRGLLPVVLALTLFAEGLSFDVLVSARTPLCAWRSRCYSGFRSYGSISCMFVIMGAFPLLEDMQERADGAVEPGNGACGELAQVSLEFAVRQFDRVEVG